MNEISDVNDKRFRNWYGNIEWYDNQQHKTRVVVPENEDDLVAILRDNAYPSPVRPMGSRHSVTECMCARGKSGNWGTAIDMTGMKVKGGNFPLVDQNSMTVTVPAGCTFLEVSRELRKQGFQLPVITEIGSLTMGAAACGATKESSFPDEFGQVGSYAVGMRLVTPDGKIREVRRGNPDLEALRCSYGLFGVASEVTFQVIPHQCISIEHIEIQIEDFEDRTKDWLDDGYSVFLYLFPSTRRIVAELRRKIRDGQDDNERGELRLKARNFFWEKGMPVVPGVLEDKIVQDFLRSMPKLQVSPVRQIVDFEGDAFKKDGRKFTFSMWAFPENGFARILSEYFDFCEEKQSKDLRNRMPDVSYHIAKDESSLLSYSHDSNVWTLDPVSPGDDPEWENFLRDFNNRCCDDWGGVPLLNQTPHLEKRHIDKAFGPRLAKFEEARKRFDPGNRMLNDYFEKLLT